MPNTQAEAFADGRLILHAGRIARLTLDAPRTRNALTQSMWAALPGICARVGADTSIRALIVTGAGSNFCAGADISEFAQVYATSDTALVYNTAVRAGQAALRNVPQPVIAMIRGACVGGGCGIALSCDLRFAERGAGFAIPPARLGIAYTPADTAQLVDKIGPARSKDMLFSARRIAAGEALAIGLIDRLCEADALGAVVMEYAESMTALSPASLRVTKAIVNGLTPVPGLPAPDLAALERDFAALFSGPDFTEGRSAFLERRDPAF